MNELVNNLLQSAAQNKETFDLMIDNMLQYTAKTRRVTVSGALRDLEQLFKARDFDQTDTGNQELIMTYYA